MTTLSAPSADRVRALRRPARARLAWLVVVLTVLLVLMVASVVVGSRGVSVAEVIAGLRGATDSMGTAAVHLRLPRTVLGVLVGGALGLSGCVMQGVTRNPLAGPGILGINMGASLAVVTAIVWVGLDTATAYIWTAIGGAAVTAVVVWTIGSLGRGGATPLKLALAGAASTAALSSFIVAVSLPRADLADTIRSWQIGGIGGASFSSIGQVLPFLVGGLVLSLLSARSLNSLALGEELAAGLGERVALVRALAAAGAVALCGAATAVAGPIIFVGLMVPHLCRLLVGVDHRWLMPFSALAGACLLLGADVVGRVVARPGELDVGIVTALIGAPWFILVVRRSRSRAL